MPLHDTSRDPNRTALNIAGIYTILAAAWILLSDRLVEWFAATPAQITLFQTLKGWGFVAVTAAGLYAIIRRELSLARRSQARLEALAEQSLAGVFALEDGRIADVNPRLVEMLGYDDEEELIATETERIIHPEDCEEVRDLRRRTADDPPAERRARVRMLRKSGEVMHADLVAGRVDVDGTPATVGLVLDSTHQVRLEEQLRRAQRMESLGELTGAIAHDFNNLLAGIIGPLEFCEEDLPEDHPNREDVRLARTTAERAASLSRQLLTFSRKRIARSRAVDLNRPVGALRPLVEQLTGESVEVRFEQTEGSLPVVLDPGHVEQVLVNLVVNAVDAMPDGGTLTVRTERIPPSQNTLRHRDGLEPGTHALLEVSDTGVGIPEEVRLQVFEPFFTTKKEGTGLGLSTAYGIVDQAGGFIRVESEPGEGTTFRIFLPLTDRPVEDGEGREEEAGAEEAAGGASVLVVEDEDAVRSIFERMLGRAGYAVRAAPDGETALEMWRDGSGAVDLLVTDLMLPGMSGLELAERLREDAPELPVVFTSGYSERDLTEEVAGDVEGHFLEKPFAAEELEARVRAALAGGGR